MSARFGRPRRARRALDSARRAPAPTAALRRRLAAALAECSEDERNVLALLVGEGLSPAETSLALELPAARLLSMRTTLLETLRRALFGETVKRVARTRGAVSIDLQRAS